MVIIPLGLQLVVNREGQQGMQKTPLQSQICISEQAPRVISLLLLLVETLVLQNNDPLALPLLIPELLTSQ